MTLATLVQQQQIAGAGHVPIPPPAVGRRFTVWNGVTINPAYKALTDVAAAVWDLVPPGAWDEVEWLVKAGEGGTWQAAWDSHPLAVSGSEKLAWLRDQGRALGLRVTPYVVVRGNPAWRAPELEQIRECVAACGRCVLNLEPGSQYAHPAICSPAGAAEYMDELGLPPESLELCAIPRVTQIFELGGPETLSVWLSWVATASWECYGLISQSLRVDIATKVLEANFPGIPPRKCIPVVQKPELETWAATEYAAAGLQAWHLDAQGSNV